MVTIQTVLDLLTQYFDDVVFLGSQHCLETPLAGIQTLDKATQQDISFVVDKRLFPQLSQTAAGLVLLPLNAPETHVNAAIKVADPYLAYAYASNLFVADEKPRGIDATALVAASAKVHADAYIGPYVVIGEQVTIAADVHVSAHCSIGSNSALGQGTRLYPRVNMYHGVTIGQACIIHSGAVLGADGFGFAPTQRQQWQKISQLGGVSIGDHVEIGANTTIDRGAIEDTVIGNGVIIDNQVQIAHNVKIGDNTAIAGCVGIAGSSIVGKNCRLAGGVGLAGHLEIADNVTITGMSMVTKSITQAGSYSSGTPLQETKVWRRNAARYAKLDKTVRNKLIN